MEPLMIKSFDVLPCNQPPLILEPATDITALESAHLAMLLVLITGDTVGRLWQFVLDHKLERHFKRSQNDPVLPTP